MLVGETVRGRDGQSVGEEHLPKSTSLEAYTCEWQGDERVRGSAALGRDKRERGCR
mgnify:CR=1 FL=1